LGHSFGQFIEFVVHNFPFVFLGSWSAVIAFILLLPEIGYRITRNVEIPEMAATKAGSEPKGSPFAISL